MKRVFILLIIYAGSVVFAQTDETIFREFRFDFTTPGARANALGKAFVGLADEATAAYNNPAGLTVLEHPEVTLEYRNDTNQYAYLEADSRFMLLNGEVLQPENVGAKLSFASLSFSKFNTNFSVFYVNQLNYARELPREETSWLNLERGYQFSYGNQHRVEMVLDTYGFGFGRKFDRLSIGAAVGLSRLDLNYKYRTRLIADDINMDQLVDSQTEGQHSEISFVLGAMFRIQPGLKLGMAYKKLPTFRYSEDVQAWPSPDYHPVPIIFKVPDSLTMGISYLPTDRVTLLLDFNRIWYSQLAGDNFTVISGSSFTKNDYSTPAVTEAHFGIEYLVPWRKHILAFRGGGYMNPDHKTRFINHDETPSSEIQTFVFNTGTEETSIAYTLGFGYVWKNKLQLDFAVVREGQQFKSFISSILYRFGNK